MTTWTTCPGCRLQLPADRAEPDHRVNASPECLQVYAEVCGFASQHPPLMRLHQLGVDAYGAQHGGGGARPIRLAYSLVGLHLALERSLAGEQVRAAHQRMGKPDPTWPAFTRPDDPGSVTVMTVAEEGLMSDSPPGHAAATLLWAEAVWLAWHEEHGAVRTLAERLLAHPRS